MTIGDIKTDLIKDFNNSVPVVVSAKLSYIILDKNTIDSSARILANIINNFFRNLSPFLMVLSSSSLLTFLPSLTTDNSDKILITFTYYMLICIWDFISS